MYGDKGPPKGYSVPRFESGAKRVCQYCSSVEHWSYECPKKKAASDKTALPGNKATTSTAGTSQPSSSGTARLSRTQMLKYGLRRKRAEFVPEPTEKEVYEQEMRALEKTLVAEVRDDIQTKKRAETDGHDASSHDTESRPAQRRRKEQDDVDPTAVVKSETNAEGNE